MFAIVLVGYLLEFGWLPVVWLKLRLRVAVYFDFFIVVVLCVAWCFEFVCLFYLFYGCFTCCFWFLAVRIDVLVYDDCFDFYLICCVCWCYLGLLVCYFNCGFSLVVLVVLVLDYLFWGFYLVYVCGFDCLLLFYLDCVIVLIGFVCFRILAVVLRLFTLDWFGHFVPFLLFTSSLICDCICLVYLMLYYTVSL